MTIEMEYPNAQADPDLQTRWENHITGKGYPFTKRKHGDSVRYKISIQEPLEAFWLGCNFVSITNRLFDGPLTMSG